MAQMASLWLYSSESDCLQPSILWTHDGIALGVFYECGNVIGNEQDEH